MKQVENVKNLFNFKQYTNQTNNHYSLKFVFIPLSTHDFRKFFKTSFCLNKCPWRHLQQINFWNDEFYWKNRQLESDSYQIQKVGDKEKNNQGFPLGIGLWEGHFKQNGKKLAENYKVNTFAANHWERHVGNEGDSSSPPPPTSGETLRIQYLSYTSHCKYKFSPYSVSTAFFALFFTERKRESVLLKETRNSNFCATHNNCFLYI